MIIVANIQRNSAIGYRLSFFLIKSDDMSSKDIPEVTNYKERTRYKQIYGLPFLHYGLIFLSLQTNNATIPIIINTIFIYPK